MLCSLEIFVEEIENQSLHILQVYEISIARISFAKISVIKVFLIYISYVFYLHISTFIWSISQAHWICDELIYKKPSNRDSI